ncbi:ATP-binding Cassette (ABC) Superfamily [Thraustotheca clavata]|uniref:ATP-binding Cassette (ABC) Superfamily n=1 Tax=Thraustotheca clavata TaxID=74557 RepID=A0A1V9ZS60_9STRA|nr:ATP-binding Cassette (ABC) Superfamily [Thraustotheca clavata]
MPQTFIGLEAFHPDGDVDCIVSYNICTGEVNLIEGIEKFKGQIFQNGDILTISYDRHAGMIRFAKNGLDMGLKIENIPDKKYYPYEIPFLTQINTKRALELKCLRSSFSGDCGFFCCLGYNLDIGTALTSVALFEILRVPLYNIPASINAIVEAIVSFDRPESFLWLEEKILVTNGPLEQPGILLQNASFSWLSDITMEWNCNSLAAIVGPVGAGKSTLLLGILGDAICSNGSV